MADTTTEANEQESLPELTGEEQLSSLDILWQSLFHELDDWAKSAEFCDQVLLRKAQLFAENIRRNQSNAKAMVEQFYKELGEWEKAARDEFLMSTTSLAHFFPIKSYEVINAQINELQEKTMALMKQPFQVIEDFQAVDKYVEMIEQYLLLRKQMRKQYLQTLKHAGNLVYENQKGFVNVFAKNVKAFIFPLNKYLEKSEDLTNS